MNKEIKVLDKGFVRLVDYMGNDSSIVQAARVSYGDGTKTKREDRGLIRYLLRNEHCYDYKTEVLTDRGFIFFKDLLESDRVAAIDPEDAKFIGFEKPIEYLKYDYNDIMYKYNCDIDLCVSKNHKIYYNNFKKKNSKYSLDVISREIINNGNGKKYEIGESLLRMKKCSSGNKYKSNENYINEDIAKLVGFYIGDGFIYSRNIISFRLIKDRKIKYLINILNKLGFEYELKKHGKVCQFLIRDYSFTEYIYDRFNNIKAKTKYIPKEIWYSNQDTISGFFDGLKNSDGSIRRSTWVYSTTSELLSNQIQALGAINGLSFSINRKTTNNNCLFVLNLNSRRNETILNDSRNINSYVKKEYYSGKIYSVRVSTGLIVVRRNDKVVLSGNSSPFEMVEFKFHMKMPLFVARQLVR